MTQKQVDLQKLLELEQQRHYQDFQVEESKAVVVNIQDPLAETMKSLEKELNLDIFSSDNAIEKKITKKQRSKSPINKYSSTKVKARNFLSNVSYNRIKNSDYQNRSFIIDCFSFLLLYLNPFYLERKFESTIERDYVNELWSFLMPETLYNFTCRDDNFKTLNKLKLKFHHANEIVKLFIEDESLSSQQQQFDILKDYLIKHAKSYQFIYGNLFPRCFARIDDYGIQSKTAFSVHYKNYLTQKSVFEWHQKNSFLASMDSIDESDENTSANSTPLNMTKLNEEEKEDIGFKKEDDTTPVVTTTVVVVDDEKNENKKEKKKKRAREIVLEKINEEEKKEKKKMKLKMNAEKKRQKRNEKKRKLEEQLIENTQKLQKIKINK